MTRRSLSDAARGPGEHDARADTAPATGFPSVPSFSEEGSVRLKRTLLWLIGGRLAVAGVLLGATLVMALRAEAGPDSFTPRYLLSLIGAIYAASLVSALGLRVSRRLERIAAAQLAADLLATTGLVYVTGGFASGFTFLYGASALMGALMLGPIASRLAGFAAMLLYGAMGCLLYTGTLPPPPDQLDAPYQLSGSEATYLVLVNALGLALVVVLADNLARRLRRTGGQLLLAEASAQRLAQLNEDIVRSLTSGLITTDLQGRIIRVNPVALEMFRSSEQALIGTHIDALIPDALIGSQEPNARGGPAARLESTALRPDRTTFPIGYSATRLINADGEAFGRVIVFQDLTEISQLRDTAERAERLAALGRLAAGLAHEIRNPLSSISGSVQLVKDSPALDAEDRRLLGIVLSEADRLNELVSTMLDVGKPRQPERSRQDLRRILGEVVEMASRGPAAMAGVHVAHANPAHPVLADVDGGQLRQVVWNLVKNAIQASPPASTVRVEVETGAEVVILVRDEGRGLSPEQQARIFDMFYSGRTHGVGLGLALARQIVEAHGGRIHVQSEVGRGATFRVVLPQPAPSQLPDPPDAERILT